jgi:hypothetical protein
MSREPADYFVVADVWEAAKGKGIALFGHSPQVDTPWPRPAELVELLAPDGTAVHVPITGIDKELSQFHGANPSNRLVLIPRQSVQSASLQGFRVRALRNQSDSTSWIRRLTRSILPFSQT